MTVQELLEATRKLTERWDNIRISGQGWSGDARRGFQFNPIRTSSGVAPTPITTGACCPTVGSCFVTSQAICEAGGGTYQGDGTDCVPDPCVAFVCDGSTTVHAEIIASNQNGTCPSNITITTINPGSISGDYVFNSESSLGTAIYCTFGSGTMEITNGSLHCICLTDSLTDDRAMIIGMRLVIVIVAGDILGTPYNVGDWVLTIGSTYLITEVGVCSFCISSHSSTWLVFPTISNTTTISDAGVSVDLELTFSY